eukprot:9199659-Heterocapsa_arctica.AAC.1
MHACAPPRPSRPNVSTALCRALDPRPAPAQVAGQERGSERKKRPLGRKGLSNESPNANVVYERCVHKSRPAGRCHASQPLEVRRSPPTTPSLSWLEQAASAYALLQTNNLQ